MYVLGLTITKRINYIVAAYLTIEEKGTWDPLAAIFLSLHRRLLLLLVSHVKPPLLGVVQTDILLRTRGSHVPLLPSTSSARMRLWGFLLRPDSIRLLIKRDSRHASGFEDLCAYTPWNARRYVSVVLWNPARANFPTPIAYYYRFNWNCSI